MCAIIESCGEMGSSVHCEVQRVLQDVVRTSVNITAIRGGMVSLVLRLLVYVELQNDPRFNERKVGMRS